MTISMLFDKVNVIGSIVSFPFLVLGLAVLFHQPPLPLPLWLSAALYITAAVLSVVSSIAIDSTKPNLVQAIPILTGSRYGLLGLGLSELVFFALVFLVAMILQGSAQYTFG